MVLKEGSWLRRRIHQVVAGLGVAAALGAGLIAALPPPGGGSSGPCTECVIPDSSITAAEVAFKGVSASAWWQRGAVYQAYPWSFADSNGDGTGDIPGILSKLDHIVSLNVSAIWLNPVFLSPMRDFGYDIQNYTQVDPLFGSNDDLFDLIAAAHNRNLALILDLVPNHTSDLHRWFNRSISSGLGSDARNMYIWQPPGPNGSEPTNWRSFFGGSAWSYSNLTRMYYLHQFLPSQPDLNWTNPEVEENIYGVMRHWLKRGIDGFRVDSPYVLYEDPEFRDEPQDETFKQKPYMERPHGALIHDNITQNVNSTHNTLKVMRNVTTSANDSKVLICETVNVSHEQLFWYYGGDKLDECHLPWNFGLTKWDSSWNASDLRCEISDYLHSIPHGAWPNFVLSSHDVRRVRTRLGGSENALRLAYTLLLMLPGTPTIYYGDEIAMADVQVPSSQMRDTAATQYSDPSVRKRLSRDPARTPMQWNATECVGFSLTANCSSVKPWLPFGNNFKSVNVETETESETSVLALVRALMAERRSRSAVLETSALVMLGHDDQSRLLSFLRPPLRGGSSECLLLLANLSPSQTLIFRPASLMKRRPDMRHTFEVIDSQTVKQSANTRLDIERSLRLQPLSSKVLSLLCNSMNDIVH